jgi:hypothetical protein
VHPEEVGELVELNGFDCANLHPSIPCSRQLRAPPHHKLRTRVYQPCHVATLAHDPCCPNKAGGAAVL